jgi:hypothetical protein
MNGYEEGSSRPEETPELAKGYYHVEEVPNEEHRPRSASDLRPPATPPKASAIPEDVRQPQDRQAALQAQVNEAQEGDQLVSVVYNGVRFEFHTDALTFQFQLDAEQGKIATALLALLGEAQFDKIKPWPLRHFKGLSDAIGKATGAGNS